MVSVSGKRVPYLGLLVNTPWWNVLGLIRKHGIQCLLCAKTGRRSLLYVGLLAIPLTRRVFALTSRAPSSPHDSVKLSLHRLG